MTNARFAKLLVWINGAVPAAVLLWDAWHHRLGANPVNFAIRTTGLLSLIFLMGSLFVTPLRQLSGIDVLIPHRRTLGLYAAFYAFAHFGIFFWWDRQRSVGSTIHEIIVRQYIWYGMVALLIFIPLAITSTQGMIRRLRPKRWKMLHRLVYLAAIGGSIHYLLLNKIVTTQSIVFAGLFGALLIFREIAGHVIAARALSKLKTAAPKTAMKPKFWTGQLQLARVFRETPDVQTFRLVPAQGHELPFDYKPGQYLNVSLDVDGKKVKRSYTIASPPTRKGYCEITVKREPQGTSSRHLHDKLMAGEAVNVSAPAGKFTFTGDEAKSVVLIAGGVGITPLMSKLRYLTDLSWPGEIFLIFVARTQKDIIFRTELEELQRRHPNLHVTVTLTREDGTWPGERGRLSAEALQRIVPDLTKRRFDICGPDEMAADTRALLHQLGVPETQIKFESFTPATGGDHDAAAEIPGPSSEALPNEGTPADDASLTFARSGRSVTEIDGKSVLELAEDAGVLIDFDCRSGTCGTCKIKLLTGRVAMETQDALTKDDRANHIILACQARCLDAVTVDA